MPQDPIAGPDKFGQFLMQAYLSGMVPGDPTSSYNTVLDMLSPSAVAQREEAEVPNIPEQFATMFGIQTTPEEQVGMARQAGGLDLTAAQESTEDVAMRQADVDLNQAVMQLLGQDRRTEAMNLQTRTQAETAKGAQDVEREDLALQRERQEQLDANAKSQARYYDSLTKAGDVRMQGEMQDQMANSIVMTGRYIDFETGELGEVAPPEVIEATKAMLKIRQQDPMNATLLSAMLKSDDELLGGMARDSIMQMTGVQLNPNRFDIWHPWDTWENRGNPAVIPINPTAQTQGGEEVTMDPEMMDYLEQYRKQLGMPPQ